MKNTITQQQANERVEQYIKDAATALSTSVRLELAASQEAFDCADLTDNGPRGRVIASRGYWLRDLPQEQNAEYINAVVQSWKDHGFVVLTDSRPKDNYRRPTTTVPRRVISVRVAQRNSSAQTELRTAPGGVKQDHSGIVEGPDRMIMASSNDFDRRTARYE